MGSAKTSGVSLPEHLRLSTRPVADPGCVVAGERVRITVLSPCLVRLEYSPSGTFEDRASQVVIRRDASDLPDRPAPEFEVRRTPRRESLGEDAEEGIEVDTSGFHLSYDGGPFTSQGLSVQVKGGVSNYHSVWRFGQPPEGNLGGTARTLDGVDGPCELEPGLASIHGVAVLDDSSSLLLEDDGWLGTRESGSLDLYVFAHGRDYSAMLRDFYAITGETPMLPRYALGNWWSRYHDYSADEYEALMDRFAAQRLPFSVAVLDMDWHPVDIDPALGSGWTGYSWNRELFPDPPAFLRRLRDRGLAVTLNIHPADGVRSHEDAYPAMARAMGIEPSSGAPVAFDAADPKFLTNALTYVFHPREVEGVDFWWLDWQSGPFSALPGLDPLWILNHVHYLDSGRPGARNPRPLTFSRYAGPGSHRYPVGFSGDTVVSWESLAFQPHFTATASNIGYGWWSHDIGGHMFGAKDDELATRWVQLGVFSPILRLHSTRDRFNSKEPWRYGREPERIMGEYLRLRHRLVPYLHTMNRRAHELGEPLVRPVYHSHPWDDAAYEVPGEFTFGTQLLVAAITEPVERELGLAGVDTWLPPGEWLDLFTGLRYRAGDGGRRIRMHRTLEGNPLLARAGAVLPLAGRGDDEPVGVDNPAHLQVCVVAGDPGVGAGGEPGSATTEFVVAEDGDDERVARTPLRFDGRRIVIGPTVFDADRDASSGGAGGDSDGNGDGAGDGDGDGEGRGPITTGARAAGVLAAGRLGGRRVIPAERTWDVVVFGACGVTGASIQVSRGGLQGGGLSGALRRVEAREASAGRVLLEIGALEPGQTATVTLQGDATPADNDVLARAVRLLDDAQLDYRLKARVAEALERAADPRDGLLEVEALPTSPSLRRALAEIVLAG